MSSNQNMHTSRQSERNGQIEQQTLTSIITRERRNGASRDQIGREDARSVPVGGRRSARVGLRAGRIARGATGDSPGGGVSSGVRVPGTSLTRSQDRGRSGATTSR